MITIRIDSKFQIIAQIFDSIQYEKNTIRTALLQTARITVTMHKNVLHTANRCPQYLLIPATHMEKRIFNGGKQ